MRNYLLTNEFSMMDDLFNQIFNETSSSAYSALKTDVIKTQKGFEVEMEIPGFKKEEINLSYEKEVLTVWAERKPAESSDERSYVRAERASKVKRSFVVKGIDEEKITAKYENGLLTISLPLKEKVEGVKRVYID
jgi:HSP20 family protein